MLHTNGEPYSLDEWKDIFLKMRWIVESDLSKLTVRICQAWWEMRDFTTLEKLVSYSDEQLILLLDTNIQRMVKEKIFLPDEILAMSSHQIELLRDNLIHNCLTKKLIVKDAIDAKNEFVLCTWDRLPNAYPKLILLPGEIKAKLIQKLTRWPREEKGDIVLALIQLESFMALPDASSILQIEGVLHSVEVNLKQFPLRLYLCKVHANRLRDPEIANFCKNAWRLDRILNASEEVISAFSALKAYPGCLSLMEDSNLSLDTFNRLSIEEKERLEKYVDLVSLGIGSVAYVLSLTLIQCDTLMTFRLFIRGKITREEILGYDLPETKLKRFSPGVIGYVITKIFTIPEIADLSEEDYKRISHPFIMYSSNVEITYDRTNTDPKNRLKITCNFKQNYSRGADLSGIYLKDVNFDFDELSEFDFTNATLENISVRYVNFSKVKLTGATLKGFQFLNKQEILEEDLYKNLTRLQGKIERNPDKEKLAEAIAENLVMHGNKAKIQTVLNHPIFLYGSENNSRLTNAINFFTATVYRPWISTNCQRILLNLPKETSKLNVTPTLSATSQTSS